MNTYKNNIISRFLLTGMLILISFSSCKKEFFNINTDPNHPSDVTVNYLLPSAEAAIANAMGNDLQIFGGIWAQYWTQDGNASQYRSYDQYNPQSSDFDRPWENMYSDALEDLSTIVTKATATGQMQYVGCAKILQAYAFQVLTDNFGDIPFSQAIQAQNGIIAPHYDSQSSVYDGIISLVNAGLSIIDPTQSGKPGTPGSDDILLGGNLGLWQEFAYTLKLKMYLRLSEVDPSKAQAGIATLPSSSSSYLGAGQEVKINYLSAGGNNYNPLYSSIVALGSVQNLAASATCINYMQNNNDPRINVFYDPPLSGVQKGNPQGNYSLPPASLPSGAVGANAFDATSATAPVKLMSGYESFFLQAEAAARGWMSGGNAQALYIAGITESFSSYGITDTSLLNPYIAQDSVKYPTAGSTSQQIRSIITQKWAAMCGNQCDESWIEWRRTNYPDFFTISVTNVTGNRFPERMFYPSSEVSTNGNFPGQKLIYTKVWWDAN